MNRRDACVVLLTVILLGGCTNKPRTETAKQEPPVPVVPDPTPPPPPKSVEVPPDVKNMPLFIGMTVGGLAEEGEKEGIGIQENMRLFQTDAAAQEILSFYGKEMKDRGWTTDNKVAHSDKLGVNIQEYRRTAGSEALYVIIGEPEHGEIPDRPKRNGTSRSCPPK